MTDGIAGLLLHDKPRPSRIPALSAAVKVEVGSRTLADPPGETTHWTASATAKESSFSVSSVQRSLPPSCATSSASEPVLGRA